MKRGQALARKEGALPPLRPRVVYLLLRGSWGFPVVLVLPLFLLEWALLTLAFLLSIPGLGPGRFRLLGLLRAVFALRLLPPLPLLEVRGEGVEVRLGLF